jgi:hypothetical protein
VGNHWQNAHFYRGEVTFRGTTLKRKNAPPSQRFTSNGNDVKVRRKTQLFSAFGLCKTMSIAGQLPSDGGLKVADQRYM